MAASPREDQALTVADGSFRDDQPERLLETGTCHFGDKSRISPHPGSALVWSLPEEIENGFDLTFTASCRSFYLYFSLGPA